MTGASAPSHLFAPNTLVPSAANHYSEGGKPCRRATCNHGEGSDSCQAQCDKLRKIRPRKKNTGMKCKKGFASEAIEDSTRFIQPSNLSMKSAAAIHAASRNENAPWGTGLPFRYGYPILRTKIRHQLRRLTDSHRSTYLRFHLPAKVAV